MGKKIVYVDMDNVLVDFRSGIMKIDHDTFAKVRAGADAVPSVNNRRPESSITKSLLKSICLGASLVIRCLRVP